MEMLNTKGFSKLSDDEAKKLDGGIAVRMPVVVEAMLLNFNHRFGK